MKATVISSITIIRVACWHRMFRMLQVGDKRKTCAGKPMGASYPATGLPISAPSLRMFRHPYLALSLGNWPKTAAAFSSESWNIQQSSSQASLAGFARKLSPNFNLSDCVIGISPPTCDIPTNWLAAASLRKNGRRIISMHEGLLKWSITARNWQPVILQ